MKVQRPCLDCGRLTDASRCTTCRRARKRATYGHRDYRSLGRPSGPCQLRLPGCTGRASTWDHIVAVSKGGGHGRGNVRPACAHCNSSRGNR
ncbi:HNH endonuclease [Mycolicibacterium pulveris]|uniref:HNH endonuclease n=1 Tax=Mycolicibacterium pulveris TaxID=36813 RepID=UPI0013D23428|nr:HNH endonuclease [Mycolicibacterium pulveris]